MRKITLFVFLISSLFVSAQETESVFAPIGAKWYYGIQSSLFSPDQYFRTIESIKDTLIQDKTCSVLEIRDFFGNNNEGLTIGFTCPIKICTLLMYVFVIRSLARRLLCLVRMHVCTSSMLSLCPRALR